MKTTIEVAVSLTAPLHVAYPGGAANGMQRTTRERVLADKIIYALPIYPANGFRGGLRRAIANLVIDNITAVDGPMSADVYRGLLCGAASGSLDLTPRSIEEVVRCRKHVYMGLFGGGARMQESLYAVGDMVPVCDISIMTGRVPGYMAPMAIQVRATEEKDAATSDGDKKTETKRYRAPFQDSRHFVRVDDMYRVIDPDRIAANVADPLASVKAYQDEVSANAAARKAEKGAEDIGDDEKTTKKDSAQLQEVEVVPTGTPMFFRIDMKDGVTDAQLGAILLGLDALLQGNFGGYARWNFGTVALKSVRLTMGDESVEIDASALPSGRLVDAEKLSAYIGAARTEIAAVRLADVAEFFKDLSAADKEKKQKKAIEKKEAKKAEQLAKAGAA